MPLAHNEATFTNVTLPVGDTTIALPASSADWTTVQVDIDRTVSLNSLTSATTLNIAAEFSSDGGVTWTLAEQNSTVGGLLPNPPRLGGGNATNWNFGFSIVGQVFPSGTHWRAVFTVGGPSSVIVSGTVSWQ